MHASVNLNSIETHSGYLCRARLIIATILTVGVNTRTTQWPFLIDDPPHSLAAWSNTWITLPSTPLFTTMALIAWVWRFITMTVSKRTTTFQTMSTPRCSLNMVNGMPSNRSVCTNWSHHSNSLLTLTETSTVRACAVPLMHLRVCFEPCETCEASTLDSYVTYCFQPLVSIKRVVPETGTRRGGTI